MKVLHITNAFPYNEYESFGIFIKEQIHSLNEIGVINEVVFINARKKGSKEYFKQIKYIKKTIKSFVPDVIHCHHEFCLLPFLFIRTNTPIILSLLGDIENRSLLNKIIFNLLKRKAKKIIIKNKELNSEPFVYLPNGVNTTLFNEYNKNESKKIIKVSPKNRYILFVTASINNPIKRYDKFKSVVALLNKDNEEEFVPLIMSGVKRELVPYYYNAADLLLLTSDHEGSPNAVKEAMSCNTPVVSTNVGNVKHLFGDSKYNLIANSGTIEELHELSKRCLLTNENDGRHRIFELQLNINHIATKLYNLYKQLNKCQN